MVRILQFLLIAYERSCCRTMVSVRDIHGRNLTEDFRNLSDRFVLVYYPECVTESVQVAHKIILRSMTRYIRYNGVQIVAMGVCKEHGLYIRIVYAHVFHTILFLVLARQLVLFDAASHVVFYPRGEHQSVLCTAVHRLRIDVVLLLAILH